MNTTIRLALLFSVVLSTGCAPVTKSYLADDVFTQPVSDNKPYFTKTKDKKDEMIDLSQINIEEYENDPRKRRALISDMVALSDKKCTWHKATVMANSNIWNIGAGSLTILLAGAASVVDHAQTAADLAAGAAATSGIRSLANQEIYADALVTTILRAIDVGRTEKLAPIKAGLDDDKYTISDAVRDVQAYHDACSLMAGLVVVTAALDNRKPSRDEIERDIKFLQGQLNSPDLAKYHDDADVKKLQERLLELNIQMSKASE